MKATDFKPGDRVVLLKMDDPHRRDVPLGARGTVTSTAPEPVNVAGVRWDSGFHLNPCLDEDIIAKVEAPAVPKPAKMRFPDRVFPREGGGLRLIFWDDEVAPDAWEGLYGCLEVHDAEPEDVVRCFVDSGPYGFFEALPGYLHAIRQSRCWEVGEGVVPQSFEEFLFAEGISLTDDQVSADVAEAMYEHARSSLG